ncbi:type IV inositol polyphosphate 5-phosphatase 9-like [Telopea speciosissima]|uniref:type IV inositol polyphosphate 5-phosphatase 9-like n=1 Tax=Telopea speciosissima TaxID=54955 RepID=UPI001CC33BC5|nr:type IV inositol polyphosphate 5-phosphatase 9-like [Telopea speciosissima]
MIMQGTQGEVIWPRLVVNKILRKRLGSNNFVRDFSNNTESLLEVPSSDQELPNHKTVFSDDPKYIPNYKLFVSTWNVGGVEPPENLNLEDLLDTNNNPCDIYVLGFQEIVTLTAGNILGSENTKICMKWISLIREALNKRIITTSDKKGYPVNKGDNSKKSFQCIISKQMVGIFISVWIRSDLRRYIRNESVSCVGCGIIGCLGNKGSVSVRFCLEETSFCFVCTHLASGGKEGDERHRNTNAEEILSRTSFPHGPSLNLPRTILDHDRIILLGDLNYRISLPEPITRSFVEKKEWNVLLQRDQLMVELMEGRVFEGWSEGVIEFAPTYKYYPNSDVYYGCDEAKKGEKRRAPAWCDRILWFGKGLKQNQYNRGESMLSDHRPVRAIFTAEVEVLGTLKGSIERVFLSDRHVEGLPDHFDVCPTDKFQFSRRSSFKI